MTNTELLRIALKGDANVYPVILLDNLLRISSDIPTAGKMVQENATISGRREESDFNIRGIWQMLEINKSRLENDTPQKYMTFARSEFFLGVMNSANQRKRIACDVYQIIDCSRTSIDIQLKSMNAIIECKIATKFSVYFPTYNLGC